MKHFNLKTRPRILRNKMVTLSSSQINWSFIDYFHLYKSLLYKNNEVLRI
jgi:hypothetical protein